MGALPERGAGRIVYAILRSASVRLHHPRESALVNRFGSSRVSIPSTRCYNLVDRSWLDHRLDLDCVFMRWKFFVFHATNPYSGIRVVSICRSVARVEHNGHCGRWCFYYQLLLVYFASCVWHPAKPLLENRVVFVHCIVVIMHCLSELF